MSGAMSRYEGNTFAMSPSHLSFTRELEEGSFEMRNDAMAEVTQDLKGTNYNHIICTIRYDT